MNERDFFSSWKANVILAASSIATAASGYGIYHYGNERSDAREDPAYERGTQLHWSQYHLDRAEFNLDPSFLFVIEEDVDLYDIGEFQKEIKTSHRLLDDAGQIDEHVEQLSKSVAEKVEKNDVIDEELFVEDRRQLTRIERELEEYRAEYGQSPEYRKAKSRFNNSGLGIVGSGVGAVVSSSVLTVFALGKFTFRNSDSSDQ